MTKITLKILLIIFVLYITGMTIVDHIHETIMAERKDRGIAVARILDEHRGIAVDPADAWVITVGFSDFDIVFGDGVDILHSN